MNIQLEKIGLVLNPKNVSNNWSSHAMAPTGYVDVDSKSISIFVGGWDKNGISRIYKIILDLLDPTNVLHIEDECVLDIGSDGCFDENGVFPGHVSIIDNEVYLSYTGFQIGDKIPHYNFSGLSVLKNGTFEKLSRAPFLDRHDEGLFVRAGHSFIADKGKYVSVYSSGSTFQFVGNKFRPNYNVYLKFTSGLDRELFASPGQEVVSFSKGEHGLGRPQIFKLKDCYFILYTSRTLDMKYSIGISYSVDLTNWTRYYWDIDQYKGNNGFDSEMIYFPSFVRTEENGGFIFYSGNGFGRDGLGVFKVFFKF